MGKESALAARIREGCRLGRREAVEVQNWEEFRSRRGEVVVLSRKEVLRTAREWQDMSDTVWTDGSRLESGRVGAAVEFWEKEKEGWARKVTYLGNNKEFFDTEIFAILRAVQLLNESGRTHRQQSQESSMISAAQARLWPRL